MIHTHSTINLESCLAFFLSTDEKPTDMRANYNLFSPIKHQLA